MDFTNQVLAKLSELGLSLPESPPAPAGDYVAFRLHNGIGFLAAQTPGYAEEFKGRLGEKLSLENGQRAAEQAALNSLARIREALGGFDRLIGLLHVAGHVASSDDFFDQPEVLDGASRVFNQVLGDRGLHSRTAYAAHHLPRQLSIELEITFAYQEEE